MLVWACNGVITTGYDGNRLVSVARVLNNLIYLHFASNHSPGVGAECVCAPGDAKPCRLCFSSDRFACEWWNLWLIGNDNSVVTFTSCWCLVKGVSGVGFLDFPAAHFLCTDFPFIAFQLAAWILRAFASTFWRWMSGEWALERFSCVELSNITSQWDRGNGSLRVCGASGRAVLRVLLVYILIYNITKCDPNLLFYILQMQHNFTTMVEFFMSQ